MRCTLHLNRPATAYCAACGSFYCQPCLTLCADERNYCNFCRRKLDKKAKGDVGAARDDRLAVRLAVRMRSGKTLEGTTYNLDPSRSGFDFIRHGRGHDEEMHIDFSKVNYVAILEPLDSSRRTARGEYQPKGSEIVVTFNDGEKLDGYTLKHYSDQEARFSVIPRDPRDSRMSVLVERSAVAAMQLGRIAKAQELRKLVSNPIRRLILHFYWKHPSAVITVDDLALRLERTTGAVERELGVFLEEGLVRRVGEQSTRQLKFSTPSDPVVRDTVAMMGREIEMLYFRKKTAAPKPGRTGYIGPQPR